jgi:hypothetical protein
MGRYQEVGVSPPITVLPPFDITKYSDDVQFVLGLLWVEFEAVMSTMSSLFKQPVPQPECTTCLCTELALLRSFIEPCCSRVLLAHRHD